MRKDCYNKFCCILNCWYFPSYSFRYFMLHRFHEVCICAIHKVFFKDSTEFLYISTVFIYRHLCAKQVVPVGVDNTKAFHPPAEQTLQILGPDGPMQLPNTKPALINVCWWLYPAYFPGSRHRILYSLEYKKYSKHQKITKNKSQCLLSCLYHQ